MKIEHILVGTDLSPEGLDCCAPVADLARSVGARITLIHVVPTMSAIPHGAPLAPLVDEPGVADDVDAARASMEGHRDAFGAGLDLTPVVVTGRDVADGIVEYAKDNGVDLIAVATHGHTGFRHLVLGSVAEGVVRRSHVPVLVMPRQKD
jgi:nucleotide-binding universal stress UspA family protein